VYCGSPKILTNFVLCAPMAIKQQRRDISVTCVRIPLSSNVDKVSVAVSKLVYINLIFIDSGAEINSISETSC